MTRRVTFGKPVEVPPVDGVEVDEDNAVCERRLRVYRAENKAAANHPGEPLDGTLATAQAYVNRIVRSAWWKRTCQPYADSLNGTWPVVGVHVTEGRQGGGYALYGVEWVRAARAGGVRQTIRLGHGHVNGCPAIADPWVILHELAHVLAVRAGHRGHGRPFARFYLLTVERWLGPDAARALRAGYAAEGVKYRLTR